MLNYKSVRSSAPQIRSNPALRHVGPKSGIPELLAKLLEPTPLPFPTFQLVKESTQQVLEKQQYYAWVRPAHLRAQWLVLAHGLPFLMMDSRDKSRLSSLRIPFDPASVQKHGPIVLEGAWDAQEHILWIWDVQVWDKQVVWDRLPYSKRWEIVKQVVGQILDCGHPMSDAEVQVPTWETLEAIRSRESIDCAYSIDFQPEKAGMRRSIFVLPNDNVKYKPQTHHERKQQANQVVHTGCAIVDDPDDRPKPQHKPRDQPQRDQKPREQKPKEQKQEGERQATLKKDTTSKLPDSYRLTAEDGTDLGLAAVRSLGMSKELREVLSVAEFVVVTVRWYEPFQKYEVRQIHT